MNFLNKCKILWKYEQTIHLIQSASCFRAFPVIWNVASGRDEVSLRKWSGGATHLRTIRGSIGCKKCVLLAAMLLLTAKPVYGKECKFYINWCTAIVTIKFLFDFLVPENLDSTCRTLADWTDCFQSGPALHLLANANFDFQSKLLDQRQRGVHNIFLSVGRVANENKSDLGDFYRPRSFSNCNNDQYFSAMFSLYFLQ